MVKEKAIFCLAAFQCVILLPGRVLEPFIRDFGEEFSFYDKKTRREVKKPIDSCVFCGDVARVKISVRPDQRVLLKKFLKKFFDEKDIDFRIEDLRPCKEHN